MPHCAVWLCAQVSFFVDASAAPARFALSSISALVIMNFISSVGARLPRLSDDSWLLMLLNVSSIFLYISLVEYCVVNWLIRQEQKLDDAWAAAEQGLPVVGDPTPKQSTAGRMSSNVVDPAPKSRTFTELEVAASSAAPAPQESSSEVHDRRRDVRRKAAGPCVAPWLVDRNGNLRVTANRVEGAARVLYPAAYFIVLAYFYAMLGKVPPRPTM